MKIFIQGPCKETTQQFIIVLILLFSMVCLTVVCEIIIFGFVSWLSGVVAVSSIVLAFSLSFTLEYFIIYDDKIVCKSYCFTKNICELKNVRIILLKKLNTGRSGNTKETYAILLDERKRGTADRCANKSSKPLRIPFTPQLEKFLKERLSSDVFINDENLKT